MTKRTLESHRELQFRVSIVRSGLQVDTTPNEVNVEQFAYHLLAEFEQLALTEKRPWSSKLSTKAKTSRSREAEGFKVEEVRRRNEVLYEKSGFQRIKAKMQVLLERARLPTWKSLQLVA